MEIRREIGTKMNVLIINYEFPPAGGGAGRASWHISRELAKMGIQVTVLASEGNIKRNVVSGGVHIYSVPTHRKSVHHTGPYAISEFLIKGLFAARRLVKHNNYDIIHYFFSIPTGLISFFLDQNIPYIVSLRGGDVPGYVRDEVQMLHRIATPVNRLIWRRAEAVVALSHDLGKGVRKVEPGLECQVVYNGVDTDHFRPLPISEKNGSVIHILTVCRLLKWKGIQYLFEALSATDKEMFRISVVGTGTYEPELKNRAWELGLKNQVSFVGSKAHEDLSYIYNQADIFALPSYGDSFGQVFTEAMACGLPIIAARSGGVQEFVENGVNGFLVPPKDSKSIAEAIRRLSASSELRNKMGQNNIQKIKSRFQWDAVARQYKDVYEKVKRPLI